MSDGSNGGNSNNSNSNNSNNSTKKAEKKGIALRRDDPKYKFAYRQHVVGWKDNEQEKLLEPFTSIERPLEDEGIAETRSPDAEAVLRLTPNERFYQYFRANFNRQSIDGVAHLKKETYDKTKVSISDIWNTHSGTEHPKQKEGVIRFSYLLKLGWHAGKSTDEIVEEVMGKAKTATAREGKSKTLMAALSAIRMEVAELDPMHVFAKYEGEKRGLIEHCRIALERIESQWQSASGSMPFIAQHGSYIALISRILDDIVKTGLDLGVLTVKEESRKIVFESSIPDRMKIPTTATSVLADGKLELPPRLSDEA